jgi:hypothetical protein
VTKEKKSKPLLFTDEPICQENYLACGDGNCIERGLFCNGAKDCNDGSDENACGKVFLNFFRNNLKIFKNLKNSSSIYTVA